jgi:hypothetical protein
MITHVARLESSPGARVYIATPTCKPAIVTNWRHCAPIDTTNTRPEGAHPKESAAPEGIPWETRRLGRGLDFRQLLAN